MMCYQRRLCNLGGFFIIYIYSLSFILNYLSPTVTTFGTCGMVMWGGHYFR